MSTEFAKNKLLNNISLSLFLGTAFTIFIFLVIHHTGFEKKSIALLILVPLFILSIFNINAAFLSGIGLLFAQIDLFSYRIAVFSIVPLLLSYMVTFKKTFVSTATIHKIPFLKFYLLYVFTILISLFNCTEIKPTLFALFDFFAMSISFFIIRYFVNNYSQVKFFSFIFIFFCFINGMHVLYLGLPDGERVFGFMGVTYVDFVCVATIVTLAILLYQKKKNALFLSLLAVFFLFTLFITQTRGTILALGATLVSGSFLLFFYSKKFNLSRNLIFKIFAISLIILIPGIIISFTYIPGIAERFSQLSSSESINLSDFKSFGQSSLITRLLIWLTSINAFISHPLIGIGAYSFRFQSYHYNVLPVQLYNLFVKGLSPHVTYLAVLTETGIIGLASFIIFLISTIKMTFTAFKNSITSQQIHYSFGILLLQLYIAFSMCITDAWLFGQCGMLWSIILGIALANYSMISLLNKSSIKNLIK